MHVKKSFSFFAFLVLMMGKTLFAQTLTVDASGKGNYKTIQEAINSLPDSSKTDRIILIKKGMYHEKVYLSKNHVVLQGENQSNTIITLSLARETWLCNNPSDWGVATLNLSGSDITLKNLTILNTYGLDNKADVVMDCPNAKTGTQKTIGPNGHQMALRSMATTRLKVLDCTFRAYGGDTVSPWNVKAGLYYFKGCTMEGGVDFYCPRGWAYAEDCTFICHNKEAAIWHDGSANKSSKSVLKNCTFQGDDGFKLGRYHRDAQFYLIRCSFARNMADKPINQVPAPNPVLWGQRVYYADCHRTGGDYAWFKDNVDTAPGAPETKTITARWALDNQWDPEQTNATK